MTDKATEDLFAEWRVARDELRAFERRLGLSFQGVRDPDFRNSVLPLTPEHVRELQGLVERERRLADAYRAAQISELGQQASNEFRRRDREDAVAADDGMAEADSA